MTYTIIGHCPRSGRLGVGIATYSLAVGGYCPWVDGAVAAMSTQANVNLKLGPLAMRLLDAGFSPQKVLAELDADDPDFHYRQVAIVDRNGACAAHSGTHARDWKGHICGEGFVAMGNVLAGSEVAQAMAHAFEESRDQDLDERLLLALEAGRDAGGQGNEAGEHLTERSAGLRVHAGETYSELDLRVDVHDRAVDELRRVHTIYKPYVPYYALRHRDPKNTPPQVRWVREHESP